MRNIYQKWLGALLVTLVFLIAIPKTAAADAVLSLDPAVQTVAPNASFDVQVKINAGSFDITAVDLILNFDKDKLEMLSFTPLAASFSQSVINSIDSTAGSLSYVGTNPLISQTNTGIVTVGTIQFRAKTTTGAASVSFTQKNMTAKDQTGYLTGVTATGGTYTVGTGGGTGPSVYLEPAVRTTAPSTNFDVQVKLGSSFDITGVYLKLNFDKDKLEILSFASASAFGSIINLFDNNNGTFEYAGTSSTTTTNTGNVTVGTIHFKSKTAIGPAVVSFTRNDLTATGHSGLLTGLAVTGGTYTVGTVSSVTTRAYKISESLIGLNTAPEIVYTSEPLRHNMVFANATPGPKNVWVRFIGSDNSVVDRTAQITLVTDPVVISCSVDPQNDKTEFTLTGSNFAGRGTVTRDDGTALNIKTWKDKQIVANLGNADVGQTFLVKVKTDKGIESEEFGCSAISQISLGAKLFCRAPQATILSDVDFILAEGKDKGKITRSKVTIDKKGVVQGLNQKLVENEGYKISIKAPKSVRKNVEFYVGAGTSILNNIRLPVGDIFPLDGGDGRINSADAAELFREWRVIGSGADKPGDFNGDGLINSFEWACMRFDFGASDDEEPVPGPLSKANPNKVTVQTKSANIGSTASSGIGNTASQ